MCCATVDHIPEILVSWIIWWHFDYGSWTIERDGVAWQEGKFLVREGNRQSKTKQMIKLPNEQRQRQKKENFRKITTVRDSIKAGEELKKISACNCFCSDSFLILWTLRKA